MSATSRTSRTFSVLRPTNPTSVTPGEQPLSRGQATGVGRTKSASRRSALYVVLCGKGRYQRVLSRVYRGDLDVNAELVREGMAWVYRQHSKDATLLNIEAEAKADRRGLWHDPAPVPPWEWRRERRQD